MKTSRRKQAKLRILQILSQYYEDFEYCGILKHEQDLVDSLVVLGWVTINEYSIIIRTEKRL